MPPAWLVPAVVVAQAQTTTTEVKRVVGDPLPPWVVLLAGAAVLAVILVAGVLTRRHMRRDERAAPGATPRA